MTRPLRLPLRLRLLVPVLVLALVVGPAVAWFLARDVARRSQASVDEQLLLHAVATRSAIHERELYVLEAAQFAANVRGMAEAVTRRDRRSVDELLRSVLALKNDLAGATVLGVGGEVISGLELNRDVRDTTRWTAAPRVTAFGPPAVGLVTLGSGPALAIGVPVCEGASPCEVVGTAVAAISLAKMVEEAAAGVSPPGGVTLFDASGNRLASSGSSVPYTVPPPHQSRRTEERLGGQEAAVLHSKLVIQDQPIGTVATAISADEGTGSARATAIRVGVFLLLAMIGLVVIGALLTRVTLRQIRSLVDTTRAIARGNLGSRSAVLVDDEVGELARSVNHMADELEESYSTLETRVEEATAEVRRLLTERTEFFASLSHELRTPLAVILSEARMMLDPAYRRRGQTAAWQSVEQSAAQLLEVVNAILELARAESGRLEINLVDVDVALLLTDLEHGFRRLGTAAGLKVRVETADNLAPIRADNARLRQVVVNLVDNAVKYTPPGGQVDVTVSRRDRFVVITVADTGPGIPEEAISRIFEPFYRVPGSRTQRGEPSTGLGLALARRLIEAQGGTIDVESRAPGGTTFTLAFPAASGAERKRRARAARAGTRDTSRSR